MTKLDFTVIERAHLTQQEFADVARVSRVTTNKWVVGKMAPHMYIRNRITELLDVLETAIEDDLLPLPSGMPKHKRPAAIRAVISASQGALNL
jgi:DNA-binding XRE family transcriptional regulator